MKKLFLYLVLACFFSTASTVVWSAPAKNSSQKKKASQRTSKKKTSTRRKSTRNTTRQQSSSSQKSSAEAEQRKVERKLNTLKKEIKKTEVAKDKAATDIERSEIAIRATEKSLIELGKQKSLSENNLRTLVAQQKEIENLLEKQKQKLSRIVHQQYLSGGQDHMKILFSGDNPNHIHRNLSYLGYYSTKYNNLVHSIQSNLETLDKKRALATKEKNNLEKIVKKTNNQKLVLEKEKKRHATLLSRLSNKLTNQKAQARQLEQDQKRLAALVENLNKKLETQRKEAEQSKTQQKTSKKSKKRDPAFVRTEPFKPDNKTSFGRLRGTMKAPVSGSVTARFGSRREDGPNWKGIFIKTSAGAPVHAVAPGRVIFADTLRGFGQLMIIDHGNHYMTIYGNAQSFTKRVGANVNKGETIAYAGHSAENMDTGLYFEVRQNGRAQNPLNWISL